MSSPIIFTTYVPFPLNPSTFFSIFSLLFHKVLAQKDLKRNNTDEQIRSLQNRTKMAKVLA